MSGVLGQPQMPHADDGLVDVFFAVKHLAMKLLFWLGDLGSIKGAELFFRFENCIQLFEQRCSVKIARNRQDHVVEPVKTAMKINQILAGDRTD